jgi:hypothetical protein
VPQQRKSLVEVVILEGRLLVGYTLMMPSLLERVPYLVFASTKMTED